MPLPAALLKRLSQRGIVNDALKKLPNKEHSAPAEEIIAEDYDDEEQEHPVDTEFDYQNAVQPKKPNNWSERMKRRIVDGNISAKGYRACPNKYNVHHRCAMFCINKYGEGILQPGDEYVRRKQRLLRKYPLPSDWREIYDDGWYVIVNTFGIRLISLCREKYHILLTLVCFFGLQWRALLLEHHRRYGVLVTAIASTSRHFEKCSNATPRNRSSTTRRLRRHCHGHDDRAIQF